MLSFDLYPSIQVMLIKLTSSFWQVSVKLLTVPVNLPGYDAAYRCCVEEFHRSTQDVCKHFLVHYRCGMYHTEANQSSDKQIGNR